MYIHHKGGKGLWKYWISIESNNIQTSSSYFWLYIIQSLMYSPQPPNWPLQRTETSFRLMVQLCMVILLSIHRYIHIDVLTNVAIAELSFLYFFEVVWPSSDTKTVGSGVRYLHDMTCMNIQTLTKDRETRHIDVTLETTLRKITDGTWTNDPTHSYIPWAIYIPRQLSWLSSFN